MSTMAIEVATMREISTGTEEIKHRLNRLGNDLGDESPQSYLDLSASVVALDLLVDGVELPPEIRYSLTPVNNGEGWMLMKISNDVWSEVDGVVYASLDEAASQIPGLVEQDSNADPWVQPTGAHDAYSLGAIVSHNGATWESTVDNNVWKPGVFGWVQV